MVGVPDPRYGDELCARIKLRPGAEVIDAEAPREFCRDRLAHYQLPRYVIITDGFPMTVTGKIRKVQLRAESIERLGLQPACRPSSLLIMDQKIIDYLAGHRSAAMITIRPDGSPHAVRCGIALVDGRLWSSGTRTRKRTGYLRRDPRCTLFVFGASADDQYSYLSLDTRVTVLDGPEVPDQSVQLFTVMQQDMSRPPGALYWNGQPLPLEDFRRTMIEEQRLIYQFEIIGSHGLY